MNKKYKNWYLLLIVFILSSILLSCNPVTTGILVSSSPTNLINATEVTFRWIVIDDRDEFIHYTLYNDGALALDSVGNPITGIMANNTLFEVDAILDPNKLSRTFVLEVEDMSGNKNSANITITIADMVSPQIILFEIRER